MKLNMKKNWILYVLLGLWIIGAIYTKILLLILIMTILFIGILIFSNKLAEHIKFHLKKDKNYNLSGELTALFVLILILGIIIFKTLIN